MDSAERAELLHVLVRFSSGYQRALDLAESLLAPATPSDPERLTARALLALYRAHLTSDRVRAATLLDQSAEEEPAATLAGADRPFP